MHSFVCWFLAKDFFKNPNQLQFQDKIIFFMLVVNEIFCHVCKLQEKICDWSAVTSVRFCGSSCMFTTFKDKVLRTSLRPCFPFCVEQRGGTGYISKLCIVFFCFFFTVRQKKHHWRESRQVEVLYLLLVAEVSTLHQLYLSELTCEFLSLCLVQPVENKRLGQNAEKVFDFFRLDVLPLYTRNILVWKMN